MAKRKKADNIMAKRKKTENKMVSVCVLNLMEAKIV
jgi:hypothetical protein